MHFLYRNLGCTLSKAFFGFLILSVVMANGVNAAITSKDVLIKGSGSAVYYFAADGKRYVFLTQGTYNSWFSNFNNIITITDEEMGSIPIGGNITHRPGIRMVKITTDPKVYAVDKGGILRWITTEELAIKLYGSTWNKLIDDVSDAFFVNYKPGDPITSENDFNPSAVSDAVKTVNNDKGITTGDSPRISDTSFVKTEPKEEDNETPVSAPSVIKRGTLSVALDADTPKTQDIRATTNASLSIFRFSASDEEDILIKRMRINTYPLDQPFSSECDGLVNLQATTTDYSASIINYNAEFQKPIIIPKGGSNVITISATLSYGTSECPHSWKVGLSANDTSAAEWGSLYAGRYYVEAVGAISGEKIFIESTDNAPLFGNYFNIKILQYQNI